MAVPRSAWTACFAHLFFQQWFNLSDLGAEEALYDSVAMRRFAGIDLGREAVPDETTICKFRHLLERHDMGGRMFELVNCRWSRETRDHHETQSRRRLGFQRQTWL